VLGDETSGDAASFDVFAPGDVGTVLPLAFKAAVPVPPVLLIRASGGKKTGRSMEHPIQRTNLKISTIESNLKKLSSLLRNVVIDHPITDCTLPPSGSVQEKKKKVTNCTLNDENPNFKTRKNKTMKKKT
jgi:hypothetical protein